MRLYVSLRMVLKKPKRVEDSTIYTAECVRQNKCIYLVFNIEENEYTDNVLV